MVRVGFGKLAGLGLAMALWAASGSAHAQVAGRCVPTPPCYCNQECYRCGPGGCGPTPFGSPPTIDEGAERRAREEAERQRAENDQREQERRKAEQQKQFERARDEAAKLLKGTLSTGTTGLKGLGTEPSGLRDLPSVSTLKPPDASGCGGNTDASVVDLCGMGERLVIDPANVKTPAAGAGAPRPPDPSVSAAERELDRQMDDLLASTMLDGAAVREFNRKHDEVMSRYLFEMMQPSRWPGPTNPNHRLINPLNEPARYEAWKKSIDARLKIQAQEGKSATMVERMNRDSRITAARDLIVKKQQEAEGKAFMRAQSDMQAAMEKIRKEAKLKDYKEIQNKERDDPMFRAKVKTITEAIVQTWVREERAARAAALQEMNREVDKWQSAQAAR